MHFQLFIPGQRGCSPAILESVGLGHLYGGAAYVDIGKGPDGTAGVVVAWPRPGSNEHGYFAPRQSWAPSMPNGDLPAGRYWLGLWNGSPITPDDLQRPTMLDGAPVLLGDRQTWIIPDAALLPRRWYRDWDTGQWKNIVMEQYHTFFDRSRAVQQTLSKWTNETIITLDFSWTEYVEQALALNYRLVPEIGTLLNWWNDETLLMAAGATVCRELSSRTVSELDSAKVVIVPRPLSE